MADKKSILQFILITTSILAVLAYLIFALLRFSGNDAETKCKDLIININGKIPLLKIDEVHDILNQHALHPIGQSIEQLQLDDIELLLEASPLVKEAICYHTPSGKAYLKIQLRTPKFLVSNNENYYVDEEKAIFPVPLHAAAYVPVVTGRVTKSMAKNELFQFIDFLEKHEFWNAQIAQIHVHIDKTVELVPRVGNTTIFLGGLDGYADKLNRVYLLYDQGFKAAGWNRYKKLDLRFENQIVAIKR